MPIPFGLCAMIPARWLLNNVVSIPSVLDVWRYGINTLTGTEVVVEHELSLNHCQDSACFRRP